MKKTNRLVVVEEGWGYGVGAEIASRVNELAFDYLDARPSRGPGRGAAALQPPAGADGLPQVADVINAVKDVISLK